MSNHACRAKTNIVPVSDKLAKAATAKILSLKTKQRNKDVDIGEVVLLHAPRKIAYS
jgi:hypothetical protein